MAAVSVKRSIQALVLSLAFAAGNITNLPLSRRALEKI